MLLTIKLGPLPMHVTAPSVTPPQQRYRARSVQRLDTVQRRPLRLHPERHAKDAGVLVPRCGGRRERSRWHSADRSGQRKPIRREGVRLPERQGGAQQQKGQQGQPPAAEAVKIWRPGNDCIGSSPSILHLPGQFCSRFPKINCATGRMHEEVGSMHGSRGDPLGASARCFPKVPPPLPRRTLRCCCPCWRQSGRVCRRR